jgi:hypothetical protein
MTWRPVNREDRQVAALWAVCSVLTVLLRPIWIAAVKVLPPCLWHTWTGWPCPGCGTTRAVLRLLHADPAGAFAVNPLAASAAVAFVVGGFVAPFWLACGGLRPELPARHRPAWGVGLAAAFLANWSWLAVSGA